MSEDSIFAAAMSIPTATERAAFLDDACAGNPALRQELEALAQALDQARDFLAAPLINALPAAAFAADGGEEIPRLNHFSPAEEPGTWIGPYRLLQLLGEGGMGVVYVAEQQEPVKRRVALKVIKPGMDSARVLARFASERQALALMDHTNIAKVFDAGTTATGRPYFVMELINGAPITRYCDELQLSLRERLELFLPICRAIQHAHQKGIIHRDVKPSNVLICIQDGKPVPKVIDFGLAKAVHQKLTERTTYTEIGAVMGTLEYMSPEQAELSVLDIDTRADIYALGVLLYELLTGSTPLERKRLEQAALTEAMRLIREEEPVRPSTRLTQSKDRLTRLASLRRTEPVRLMKEVRGELDWIVMKCLEKDRTRRYETANGLARDMERYLHDEPVEACPPSTGYRLKKFARKNRQLLATAAAFALLLVLATVFSVFEACRALHERDEAVAQRQRASQNYALARQAVENYLSKVADNERLKEADLHAMRQELLESALPFYEKFAQQEGDDAEGAAERGRTYYRLAQVRDLLGEDEKAQSAFRQTEGIFAALVAAHPEAPEYKRYLALSRAGMARLLTNHSQYPEAEQMRRAAVALQEQLVVDYPTVPAYRKELADIHQDLAYIQPAGSVILAPDWEKELDCALWHYDLLVRSFPKVADYFIGRESIQLSLGSALETAGRCPEAERILRRSLAALQGLPAQTRATVRLRRMEVTARNSLSAIYARQRRDDEAIQEIRACIGIAKTLADEFRSVPQYRQNLAWYHVDLGRQYRWMRLWKQAEEEFLLARTLLERLAVEYPAETDFAADAGFRDLDLALLFIEQGCPDKALHYCKIAERRWCGIGRQNPGNAYLRGADAEIRALRARVLAQQGRYAEALAEAKRSGAQSLHAYHVACVYSVLSAAALRDDKSALPDRSRIAEAHASRALELLRAIDWKKNWGLIPFLKTDKDLDPLRTRAGFIALVKRVEKSSAQPPGKQPR